MSHLTLIRDGVVTESSPFRLLDDDADIPAEGDVAITLARAVSSPPEGLRDNARGRVALFVGIADDVLRLRAVPDGIDLVLLEVPKYKDGRFFSSARLLRARLRFGGEIRVVGDVHVDQAQLMARCGVDAFELPAHRSAESFLRALRAFSHQYQATAHGPALFHAVRRGAAAREAAR